jgi:hypothetical protein
MGVSNASLCRPREGCFDSLTFCLGEELRGSVCPPPLQEAPHTDPHCPLQVAGVLMLGALLPSFLSYNCRLFWVWFNLCYYYYYFIFGGMEFEPRASRLLGRYSIT